ncbi:MAG: polyamine aminopropyltransferase, partial [Sorangiineae bacterium]|nr:polyamine aminopropyltransferase [Sorangiineae bacterium]
RWPEVEALTLVDLDPAMTRLATSDQRLRRQNQGSLTDPRVRVVNADAMTWFASSTERFDVIILDFPDPTNYSLGKLYSSRFYASARERLADDGALVVQSTNPELARRAYWCIAHTLEAAGLTLRPYHVFLPSFGDWGFLLAKRRAFPVPTALPPAPLRYLDRRTLPALFELPPDLAELPTRANRLDNQALVAYYLAAWARFD